MKLFLCMLAAIQLLAGIANADSLLSIPPRDPRIDRANFVSSLIKPGDIGAEVGVWQGVFAYHVLLQKQPERLYLIDSWAGADSDPDRGVQTSEAQRARDSIYRSVCELFAPYSNVEVIRMKSRDAVSLFPDNFFDYVYIDGDHSYEGVISDLTLYFSKIKIGGLLIGDDYGWGRVQFAVQDFLNLHKGEFIWMGNPFAPGREGQFAIKRAK